VHYKSMKCDVSFSQRNVFRWGGHFHTCLKIPSCLNSAKILKSIEVFQCYDTNVLTPFYGSQYRPTCNSYDSYHRYTRTIKMLYFHNSFQYIQKSSTYAAKSFHIICTPIFAIPPKKIQGVWINPDVVCWLLRTTFLCLLFPRLLLQLNKQSLISA